MLIGNLIPGGLKEDSYYPWDRADPFAKQVVDLLKMKIETVNLILIGGAILTNGEETLFTTCSVLHNRSRNPSKSFKEVHSLSKEALNLKKIVWIEQGLVKDETNGYVDLDKRC